MYSASITAGSLKVAESRILAGLLLRGINSEEWQLAVTDENVLQTRNPATAVRVARLIRQRLELMAPEHWRLVVDGDSTVATHALLAAAVKHSRLLGDFLDLVVREQLRVFSTELPKSCHDFVDNQVRLQLFALAYNLGNFLRRLALPRSVKHWSLTTLREKLIKIGAKVVTHARYVVFQMAEVAVPKRLFRAILERIRRLRLPEMVPG